MTNSDENKGYSFGELKGHTHGVGANKYAKTTKALVAYVSRVYSAEMRMLVKYEKEPTLTKPVHPGEKGTKQELDEWSKDYDLYSRKKEKVANEKTKVFAVTFGICEEWVQDLLETDEQFEQIELDFDVIRLLQLIKEIAFGKSERKYDHLETAKAVKAFARVFQQKEESLLSYRNRFVALEENMEREFGVLMPKQILERNVTCKKANAEEKKSIELEEKDRLRAMMFLDGANKDIYGPFLKKLADNFALDNTAKYPETLEEACRVMELYAEDKTKQKRQGGGSGGNNGDRVGTSFQQNGKERKCFRCGSKEHVIRDCPENVENESVASEVSQRSQRSSRSHNGVGVSWSG